MVIFCNENSEAELAYASFEFIFDKINIKNIKSLFVFTFYLKIIFYFWINNFSLIKFIFILNNFIEEF